MPVTSVSARSTLSKSSSNEYQILKRALVNFSCIALIAAIFSLASFFNLGTFELNSNFINVLIGSIAIYGINSVIIHKLGKYPGSKPSAYLIPTTVIMLLVLVAGINLLRLDYSRVAIVIAFIAVPLCAIIEFSYIHFRIRGKYAVMPFGFHKELVETDPKHFALLENPKLTEKCKGLIIDPNADTPDQWQTFAAHTLASDLPVLSSVSVFEALTGKSPLNHYADVTNGELKPSKFFLAFKRFYETLLIVLSSPLVLPLILVTAILIKLESRGPAFFTQRRVGLSGKEFTMYKLRSMCQDSEIKGAQFAGEDDPRITRIGKVIRKMRIDEIPQFLNIIKGDMSLIGPRPEQASFVKEFEKSIPLYSFRHVVRPGITGWAQVTHGYAASEDETREKLAHDFFYVKNLSLSLDINIVFKTIKTMLTGFGAR